jgi:hypothetical protein
MNKNIFAPYVDITLYPPFDLVSCSSQTNQKYFTLAFLVNSNNNLSWGGYYPVNERWFLDKITNLRAIGGDVIFSFGGSSGQEISEVITDIPTLVNIYQNAINLYKMTYLDFDIEGSAFANTTAIDRRNKALVILQKNNPNLLINYTIPILPSGLTQDGKNLINNIKINNLNVNIINLMTMDYGQQTTNMSAAAISAATSVHQYLLSISMTNIKIGITPMIGLNDTVPETFSLQDANSIINYAKLNSYIGLLSMWSVNRDVLQTTTSTTPSYNKSGIIQNNFDFINIFKSFSQDIIPSKPSTPSTPSTPSIPSIPSTPSTPSCIQQTTSGITIDYTTFYIILAVIIVIFVLESTYIYFNLRKSE